MVPNFFSKLVKKSQAPTPSSSNGSSPKETQVLESLRTTSTTDRPHTQTISHPTSAHLSPRTFGDELDLNAQDISVTGLAVASNNRNIDFHELFPSIPDGDYLIEDHGCALQREIQIQGRLYISEHHICFYANIFGWVTDLSIPIYEITVLEKKMTAYVIPNAIQITTLQAKYTFVSFLSRDTTYDVIANIWRLALPEDNMKLPGSRNASSRSMISTASVSDGTGKEATPGAGLSKVTYCSCSKNNSHLSEVALETVLPGTLDKIYNLMFVSGFIKDFMKVDQKFIDVQMSDWAPTSQRSGSIQRNMSYIKPLSNSVGPKQTKCEIHDESVHCDFDDHVVMLTTTKTPDVPSGGVFAVMTRTCFMWASSISTRVIVTTQVEWTGRSFIKGIIEKSTIEWQKVYYSDLDKAIRTYIQEHQSEFFPEGIHRAVVALPEPITRVAEHNGGGLEGAISGEEARKAWERDRNRLGLLVNSVTAWGLNDIRSNFAHDLTGHVVQEGERPFASGSFGDIYRGTLRMKGRTINVAVKAIRTYSVDDGDDAKKSKKFRRELKTWLNLDHINILPLFGTTTNFGQFPAMVCPWLENGSLTAYLERRYDTLTVVERLTLVSDVAAGLQYLHCQSVVHGDLSGANVLIHANERACISDFGLSTLLTQLGGSTFATTHQAPGTLRWTAPELLDFQEPEDEGDPPYIVPSPQSDVYSFGRIMLQILTGKVPYHYCVREAQVVHAMSRGVNPKRPSQELVTDRQWTFIERCWTPVNADQSRPGDEEILEFAKQELEMASL